ncbi:MAG: tRNA (guanosine(37)-N1)-methyltransferase TrmD [Calditrichaceae bacterium]
MDIVTGFPKMLEAPLNESMIRVASRNEAVQITIHNTRDFTTDKHRTIDDYPYGGGPGMVLKIEPIVKCMDRIFDDTDKKTAKVILPSPRGKVINQRDITRFSLEKHLVFVCGHYKGIDERIHEFYPIEEYSIGDYVLSSGEIAALVIIDSVIRLLPGVLGDIDSAWTDSFSDDLLDAPYYTRPETYKNVRVPEILLSGNHKKIESWRMKIREEETRKRRPDLYEKYKKQ